MTPASLVAANFWFHWMGWVLVLSSIGIIVALGVGYYVKVTSHKYPRQ